LYGAILISDTTLHCAVAISSATPELLNDLVVANHILANEGVVDAFGHVSVRHPDRPDQYVIARSVGPERVTRDDLQLFTFDGTQVDGDGRPAYAERAIHAAVYSARPDVQSVCHNHSPSVIPFGITDVRLRPLFHMAGLIGSAVPIWDIAAEFGDTDLLVRTSEQGQSLARTLGSRRVALMRGHGSVVAGSSLREVVTCCVYLEQNARLLLQALSLGRPITYLTDAETEHTAHMLTHSLAADRAWTTWAARVAARRD
jgi:ribulose-5-phosphate 4-epimerase/fuculose-1-phosphate aldolase